MGIEIGTRAVTLLALPLALACGVSQQTPPGQDAASSSDMPAASGDADDVGGCAASTPRRTLRAGPADYRDVLGTLVAGDRLLLEPGTYSRGLPLSGADGEPGACISVGGPETWPPTAVFTVTTCCNTVSLRDSSYLVLRNLTIDGTGDTISADGVKAEVGGPNAADYVHHVTLERLLIRNHDLSQQTVCISTKVPAWNWVVRESELQNCGTGMYFGDSDGGDEFVAGLIEHNLVVDSIGYNLQIKHQNRRDLALGQPAEGDTTIRYNVFSKGGNSSRGGDARPNVLVGHWPLSGSGSDDEYFVYGNFFYANPTGFEALFQGEGNVNLYANLLVNPEGPAVFIQAQNDVPRRVRLFHNTVVASGAGLFVTGADTARHEQWLIGNAVFAGDPLRGGTRVADNVTGTRAAAVSYLTQPLGAPGADLDLFPIAGSPLIGPVELGGLAPLPDADRDFNGRRREQSYRGAYAGEGPNPGWRPALARRPPLAGSARRPPQPQG